MQRIFTEVLNVNSTDFTINAICLLQFLDRHAFHTGKTVNFT